MMKITYKAVDSMELVTVQTLTYAVIHEADGVYLRYAPNNVRDKDEIFTDIVVELDMVDHHLVVEKKNELIFDKLDRPETLEKFMEGLMKKLTRYYSLEEIFMEDYGMSKEELYENIAYLEQILDINI